jgi:chromosome segregation ATPase
METERTAAVTLQQQLAQLQSAHQSERNAGVARERDLAAVQQALEQELRQEQAALANLRRQLEDAQEAAVSVQQALEQAQAALRSERAGAGRDHDLAQAKDALERELKREQTAHAKLREQVESARGASEGDRAKTQTELERAAREAAARAEAAAREHKKLLAELDSVKQAAFASEADAKARYEKLRDAADQQIRSLQLRVNEADQRATSAEGDLELLRRAAKARDADAERVPSSAASPQAGPPSPDGPVRAAKRTAMSGEVDIQIDGNASKLIDLSITGAQILSPGALKPNRLITLVLPLAEGRVSCKGKIMWSRLEPGRKGGLWYRAGISFTTADEGAIEQFLNQLSRGKK